MRLHPSAAWRDYFAITALTSASGATAVLVPLILTDAGYPPSQIGFLVAALGIASLLSRVPIGSVYRPARARWLLVVSVLVAGLTNLLYPLAVVSADMFLAVRVVSGLAEGTATTVNLAAFLDSLAPGVSRARGMSLYGGGMAAGFMIGNLVAGFAVDLFGYSWAFGLCAAMWMVALVQVVAAPREAQPQPGPPAGSMPARGWPRLLAVLSAIRDPRIAAVNVMAFCLNGLHHIGSAFFPVLALGVGLSAWEIGLVRSVHSLVNAVARPLSTPFLQRLGGRRAAAFAYICQAFLVALIPIVASGGLWAFLVLFIAIGSARAVGIVANSVSMAEDIPESRISRGLAAGIFNASKDLGNIAGPLLGSALTPIVGFERMFVVAPMVLLAVFALISWRAQGLVNRSSHS